MFSSCLRRFPPVQLCVFEKKEAAVNVKQRRLSCDPLWVLVLTQLPPLLVNLWKLKEEPEPEPSIKQEPQEIHIVSVKSEADEDKSCVFDPKEETSAEECGAGAEECGAEAEECGAEAEECGAEAEECGAEAEECGAEAGCSSDPLTQFHSDSEEHTDSSEEAPLTPKRSYAMIPPDAELQDHRPYSCSECDKSFKTKSHLQQHMFSHTDERPHKCPECGKMFKDKSNLNKHITTHTEARLTAAQSVGRALRRRHIYSITCTHTQTKGLAAAQSVGRALGGSLIWSCTSSFTRQKSLTNVQFVCEQKFTNDEDLREHLRTHVDEGTAEAVTLKPYSCSDLRPYSCSVCEKTFVNKHDLTCHMTVHSTERPHKCSECGESYKRKGCLNRHLRVIHHLSS
ncbi:hypothetical protein WMY93_006739 [Mugilogobius chulae]|uniref:C2H2-type domain-containing protein n=1 Tax=Mugilogobius chulae TaxID=88201 RepID=A0AAW0PP60_9GOBI